MQHSVNNMRAAANTRQQLYSCPVCRRWSRMQQPYSRRQQRCTASASDPPPPNRNRKPQTSRVEAFMRSTPGLNRFVDGTLLAGDVVMVLATQVSSDRLSWEEMPYLAAVLAISWVAASGLCGDYMMVPDPDDNPLSDAMGWPAVRGIVSACITWAATIPLALAGYAWLVSHWLVEPVSVMEVPRDGQLSPQLEVSVALLITMSCWRGMAARLRSMEGQ